MPPPSTLWAITRYIGFQMNEDITCKHGNLLRVGLLRKENFRWADLVQENLKRVRGFPESNPLMRGQSEIKQQGYALVL